MFPQIRIFFKRKITLVIFFFVVVISLSSCGPDDSISKKVLSEAKKNFSVLPENFFKKGDTPSKEKIELGRMLFFETSISIDGKTGCKTCHFAAKHGTDGLPKSRGNNGKLNPRNAPTVFNAALQSTQHWRADRVDVEDQAIRSLTGGASFGAPNRAFVEKKLSESKIYRELFAKVYPKDKKAISAKNFADAVGAFERTLVSKSRFDNFLQGDLKALNKDEVEGLQLFMTQGCASCHDGPLLGGNTLEKFGIKKPYYSALNIKQGEKIDHGRKDVTGKEEDLDVFKVPNLRNVEKTAPYFHDGSVNDLGRSVEIMADLQLGKKLSQEDTKKIVLFLNALTGPVPKNFHE